MRVERFKEICNDHGLVQLSEEETQKLMMGGKAAIQERLRALLVNQLR